MFKNSMRVTAGILSAAVVSSLVVFPQISHAQTTHKLDLASELLNVRKHQMVQKVEHYATTHRDAIANAVKLAQTRVGAKVVSTDPVEYKNSIDSLTMHQYFFTVAADSQVTVTDVANNPDVMYEITDMAAPGATPKMYKSGDTLPAGNYFFVVTSTKDTATNYDYTVSGVSFDGVPDATLPVYTVTSPTEHAPILPAGTTTITYAGTTDVTSVASATLYPAGSMPATLGATFSVDVPAQVGNNPAEMDFAKADGNSVQEFFAPVVKGVVRLAGTDRYQGSALVSEQLPVMSDTVIIASGTGFPDGLSGGSIAGFNGAPIFLTKANGLSQKVIEDIQERSASKAFILGGTGVVSTAVETQLKAMGITVTRLSGSDRYGTSAAVANELSKELTVTGAPDVDEAIVVSGQGFPDALSASSPSAFYGLPILLVKPTAIPASIQQYITSHNIKKFDIVGGPGVVSTSVENQLVTIAGTSTNVHRFFGQNRYQTSVEVANDFAMDPTNMVVADGLNFPDALAGGPFAAYLGGPILLTSPAALSTDVSGYVTNATNKQVIYILGGIGAVSANVETQLNGLMK